MGRAQTSVLEREGDGVRVSRVGPAMPECWGLTVGKEGAMRLKRKPRCQSW